MQTEVDFATRLPWRWGRFEVLIVEDDAAHAELITDMLCPLGVEVSRVQKGTEAMAAMSDRVFDLVILDLDLGPGISGMAVLRWIRNQRMETPVIVATAMDDAASIREALKLGAKDYVVKQAGYLDELLAAALKCLPSREDSASAIPPEAAVDRLARGVFVGRTRELSQLEEALHAAAAGRGRLVLLAGEPGIGKTTLVGWVAKRAPELGFGLLRASADDTGGTPAFHLWAQILREYCKWPESAAVIAAERISAASLLPLIQELAEHLPGVSLPAMDSDEARFHLMEAVSVILREAARTHPLLIAVEDLQRADEPSLRLLRFIAREMEATRMLIVGTYRSGEAGEPLRDILGEVAREPAAILFPLRGLSESEVREQVASVFGQLCARPFGRMLHARTAGNPLFVQEILRHLVEEKIVFHDGTRWISPISPEEIPIPQNVRNVIRRRIERVSPHCRSVLAAAAVSGREFDARIVQELAALSGGDFAAALSQAEDASLIARVRGNRYRFLHPLVQEVLDHQLGPAERTELHWRTGEALESLYGSQNEAHVERLAHHFVEGVQAGDAEKAIRYAVRAGQRASATMGHEEAARHYEAALQIIARCGAGQEERRCEILLLLSDALRRAGAFDRAREAAARAVEAARGTGRGEDLARAALAFAGQQRGFGAVACDADVVRLLEEGVRALRGGDRYLRPLLLARLAEELVFTPSEETGRSLALEAIQLAHSQDDPSVLAATLKTIHWALWVPEGADNRLALGDEIVRLADQTGDRAMRLEGQLFRVWSLIELGNSRAARHELHLCAQLARSQRQPYHLWVVAITRVCLAFMTGQLDRAEALAQEAFRLGQAAMNPNVFLFQSAQIGHLLFLRGRFDELQERLTGILDPHPLLAPTISCARMGMYCEQRRQPEARAEFERWAADGFSGIQRNFTWLANMTTISRVCAFLGDAARAERLYTMLLPFSGRNVVTVPVFVHGAASLYLGLLAATLERWEDAERHFTDALEMNTGMGTKQWVARTQLAYGRMLLCRGRSGDRSHARELLEAAAQGAKALRMPVVLEQAREELARTPGPAGRAIAEETGSSPRAQDERTRPDAREQEAVDQAIRAADHATRLMLHEEAVQHLEKALEGLEAADLRRGQILVLLAEGLWRTGAFDRARKVALGAVQMARERGNAELLARASLAYAGRLTAFGVVTCSEPVLAVLEESLRALDETCDGLRAQLLGRLAEELSLAQENEKRLPSARLAITLARRDGDPGVVAAVLKSTYWTLWVPAELDQRQAVAEEIVGLATELGDRALALEGRVFRLLALLERGDIAAAHRDLDACERLAQQLQQPYHRWVVNVVRGCMALMEGRLKDAEHLVPEALKLTDPAHNPNAALMFGVQWGHLLWLRGRAHEVETLLDGLGSLSPVLNHVIRCVLASLYCEQGRLTEARNEFERLASQDFTDVPQDVTWLYSMAVLAGVCGMLGDDTHARLLYETLCPFADRIVVLAPAVAFGSVSYCLGQLATVMHDWKAAARHFVEALSVHRRLGMPHWLAMTQVEYARMLLLQGHADQREQAQALLSAALHAATEMGLPTVAARARAVEAESGEAQTAAASRSDIPSDSRQLLTEVPMAPGSGEQRITRQTDALFRREGEFWTLGFEGKVLHVKDLVGLHYICELLRRPGEPVPVTVLAAAACGGPRAHDLQPELHAEGLNPAGSKSDASVADARALLAYRHRLREDVKLLEEAKRQNDRFETTRLEREIDRLTEQLEGSWRRWKASPETERLRQNVTKDIKRALDKIGAEHPKLAGYLTAHIRRGHFCTYEPDPDRALRWQF